jgi:pyruvate kinase
MDKIIREAEAIPLTASSPVVFEGASDSEAVCRAAVALAGELEVTALTALTRSGRTAQILSKMRPGTPILAFLWENESLARRLNLWRGIVPLVVHETPVRGETNQIILRELKARGLVQPGNQVVVVGAAPGAAAGSTNLIRLLRV